MATIKMNDKQDDNARIDTNDTGKYDGEGQTFSLGSAFRAGSAIPTPLDSGAAASAPPGKQKIPTDEASLKSAPDLKVYTKIWAWLKVHQAIPTQVRELFLLCQESESIIVNALTEFDPGQIAFFVDVLRQSGLEVQSFEYHQDQVRFFEERLSQLLRDDRLLDCLNLFANVPDSEDESDSSSDSTGEYYYPPGLGIFNLPDENQSDINPERLRRHPEFDTSKPVIFRVTTLQKSLQVFIGYPDTVVKELRTWQICVMAISDDVVLPLPVLHQGWTSEKEFNATKAISNATRRSIESVGPHFLAHARRARHKRTFSEDDRIQAQESVKKVEDDDAGEISEPEDPSMLLRDAKDWKGQDHYAVLGLTKYRWKATEEQIKRAHRKKVLRHHPDKKAAAGNTEDDSFFKCIQKATEILLDPVKRRQFDSIDEAADVEPPSKKQTQKGNFYKLWNPVFKAESRFSRVQPVPKLGDEKSTKEEVENFYNFWYNFDSWRSFEYQDEDVPDDNENRDQKRHMERKNNNARKKKKTEDSARLRKLLDDCSGLDERIRKFRQEANASKNKKRLEKEATEKKAADEAKAKKEAEEKAAKEAEEAAKVEREQGKKAKEAAKNAVKKNKRVLKGSVKDANYFIKGAAPAATIDTVLNDVELVQGKVDPDEIAALASKLTGLKLAGEIKTVWSDEVKRLVGTGKLKEGDAKSLVE